MSRKPLSGMEGLGSTDVRAAALVEAQEAVSSAGDSDARTLAQEQAERCGVAGGAPGSSANGKPERAGGAQIDTVEGAVDLQRGGQPTRTARKVQEAGSVPMLFHPRDTFERLKSADEHAAADSRNFGGDVEHEVIAIAEVNVGMATAQEHGAIARRWTTKVMGGRVTLRVSLGFDNASSQARAVKFPHDDLADQEAGERHGVRGQCSASQKAEGDRCLAGRER